MKCSIPLAHHAAGAAVVLAILAAGCGSDAKPATTPTPTASSAPASSTAAAAFPVMITNCGITTTYTKAPTRAVTMNQHVTEILLALGLEKAMVGTAYIDSTIRPDLVAAYATVPVLAVEYPSREQVAAVDPDIVIGGYASAFDDEAAGSRDKLAVAHINSYLTSGYCKDFTGKNSMNSLIDDITDIGKIFGVSDSAAALLKTMQKPIDTATAAIKGAQPLRVFVYDSGTDKAFTAAGDEMTTALIELAGGKNVFDDIAKNFAEVSWEDVVARDPDVIVILNYSGDTVAEKESFLERDPVASTLRAVKAKAFVEVDLTDVVPGIRNGDTVLRLAQAFHPDKF